MKSLLSILFLAVTSFSYSQENDTIDRYDYPLKLPQIITSDCDSFPCDGLIIYFSCPLAEIKNYQLTVFNRWGEVLFESTDPNQQWRPWEHEGDYPVGVYVWQVEFSYLDDMNGDGLVEEENEQFHRGHVTYLH